MIDLWIISFYLGCLIAVVMCWDLGRVFYIPMLLNMGFNLSLNLGLLNLGDPRFAMATHGFLFTLWVLILSNMFRSKLEASLAFGLMAIAFFMGILPSLREHTSNWARWVELSTRIIQVWMMAITLVVTFVVVKSLIDAYAKKRGNDLVVNPRKRFMIPIGLWAATIIVPVDWLSSISGWLAQNRFNIAGSLLAWGWVVLEAKFFFQSWYLHRQQP